MRQQLIAVGLLGGLLALAGLHAVQAANAAAGLTAGSGAIGLAPLQEPTPVIDPQPMPEPIYLPLAQRTYDAAAPGAIASTLRGHLTELSRTGREACWPATHALLDRPEGAVDVKVLAVLRSAAPGVNLDFHVGDYVESGGVVDLAPAACRVLTEWSQAVERIESIPVPPGPGR